MLSYSKGVNLGEESLNKIEKKRSTTTLYENYVRQGNRSRAQDCFLAEIVKSASDKTDERFAGVALSLGDKR